MRKFIRYASAAAVVVAVGTTTSALQARDGLSSMFNGSMVGSGMGTINMTGMTNMMEHMGGMMGGQMGSMMEQCSQMMQDRGNASGKPNDQWRDRPQSAPDKPDKKQ